MEHRDVFERHARAVALRYMPQKDRAPKVVAKGSGRLGERILALAEDYDIPIRQDEDLLRILLKLDLFEAIPESLYVTIAEILSFVYRLNQEKGAQ